MRQKEYMQKGTRGFTLIELLIGLGIFTILSSGIMWILVTSLRSNAVLWEQLTTQNQGRRVLQQVVDDVRRAEVSSIGSYPIDEATSSTLAFYANVDSDTPRERVRFFLDGETLKKGVIQPSGMPLSYPTSTEIIIPLAEHVKNRAQGVAVFEYFDAGYTGNEPPLADPAPVTDVRVVRVQLELEEDPTETPVPLHVETMVSIRNLKEE